MTTLHVTRDLPPRIRGGISTGVGGLVSHQEGDVAVVSFDGWGPRRSGPAVVAEETLDGRTVTVCRLGGADGLADARAFAVGLAPSRVVVHHAMLWRFGAGVARDVDAPADLYVHVVQGALRRARELDEPTGSERAQGMALAEARRVYVPGEAARVLLGTVDVAAAERATILPLPRPGPVPDRGLREPGRVLLVGRFDVLKGTADALDSLSFLIERAPGCRLVLAGGLPDNVRSERRWIRRWREEVPEVVAEHLEPLGWLGPDALSAELSRASVVLAPSHMETWGLAVLEAQAHGCPVVASDIPAHREHIEHGVTGVLVPVGASEALAVAAAELLADPEGARRIGAAARLTAPGARPPA